MALGFAVTGYGEEGRLFQKSRLRDGDRLVLTKPLGSGALLAAWMRGACRAAWFNNLIRAMLKSNAAASGVFARHGVEACTDVTGFGLSGHLLEMLDASRASARLNTASVPLFAGFAEVVRQGIVSTLHADNAKTACRVVGSGGSAEWLYDPQTSGGLLAAVKADECDAVLRELREAGCEHAAVIGEVVPVAGTEGPTIQLEAPGA